jgi:hypothetical protein
MEVRPVNTSIYIYRMNTHIMKLLNSRVKYLKLLCKTRLLNLMLKIN